MTEESNASNPMGTERVSGLVLRTGVPLMISLLINSLYNFVDSVFVSRISEQCMSYLLGGISGTRTGSTEHAAYVGQAGGLAGGIYCSLISFWKSDVDLAGICTGRGRCNTDWNHSLAKRVG